MIKSPVEQPVECHRYSAEVRLELRVNGTTFDLASIGGDHFIPRQPLDLPPCDAEVVMFLNQTEYLWPVSLPHGASLSERLVESIPRGEVRRQEIKST